MSYKNHTVDNGGTTAGYDPAPAIPTSTAVGDMLVAIMQTSHQANTGNPTAPSGWFLEESGSMPINGMNGIASDSAVWIYTRTATQDDVDDIGTSPYTWTFAASEEQVGIMILCDPATWGQFAIAASSGSAVTSQNAPSVTTTDADELVFHCAMKDGGVDFTAFPSGDATMASGIIGATSGAGSAYGIIREEYASTGATGTKTFSLTSEEAEGYTFSLVPTATEGITSVDSAYGVASDELDFDDSDVDINGANFEATQGTGAVYISDAATLAGSVNEVEIDGAINTWSDILINLDFTGMTQTEVDNLHTLGPGARFIIVENDTGDEYSLAITLHRPKAFALSASANIAASGENTTAQLTAPSGKTTGDFGGGRIQDDENPTDTVDVAADEYREDEWSMEALLGAVDGETYQFRVLINSVAADTVTVTPEMTIQAGGTYDQTSFRAVEDDGSESASTWKAALNTNWNQHQDENFRIRFLVQEDDDIEELDVEFQLQYNLNSGGWNNVDGSSSVVRSSASTHFASGDTTTQRIGAGTFVGTNNGMDETDGIAGGAGMDFTTTVNQESEVEFCAQVRGVDTTRGDTIELRLVKASGSALAVYTNTPEMTIPVGSGLVLASADLLQDTAGAENPATFDFDRSEPWGAITIALRVATAEGLNLDIGEKFTTIKAGTVTFQDGASINDLTIEGDVVQSDEET